MLPTLTYRYIRSWNVANSYLPLHKVLECCQFSPPDLKLPTTVPQVSLSHTRVLLFGTVNPLHPAQPCVKCNICCVKCVKKFCSMLN